VQSELREGGRAGRPLAPTKSLTLELLEAEEELEQQQQQQQERQQPEAMAAAAAAAAAAASEADEVGVATLDDFREISLPNTPTVLDGCNDVFEEHFKVLESLESYLETQQRADTTATTTTSANDVTRHFSLWIQQQVSYRVFLWRR